MGSFARSRKRKLEKDANKGDRRADRQLKRADKDIKMAYVKDYQQQLIWRQQALLNLSACFMYAMRENYGWGKKRLMRLRNKMQSEFDAMVAGNVNVVEIGDFLRDEIGLDIEVSALKPGLERKRQIEVKAVQQMSAAFFMALLDEYGWGEKRLSVAYMHVAKLSERVSKKEISYEEIRQKVGEVMVSKKLLKEAG